MALIGEYPTLFGLLCALTGAGVAGLISSMLAKSKSALHLSRQQASWDVEKARLTEQIKGQQEGIAALQGQLEAAGEQARLKQAELTSLQNNKMELRANLAAAESKLQGREEELGTVGEAIEDFKSKLQTLERDNAASRERIATLSSELEAEKRQGTEKLTLLVEARGQLTDQFKALANEILEDKAKRFSEQNKNSLDALLEPVKTQLKDFKIKVEEVYYQESKDRITLAEQVRQLMELNHKLSTDANNLTRALKGQSKSQGDWGEMLLESVLERSGLQQGREFDVQESHPGEAGTRVQPDVVVHLPGDRHIVIDSKVSLKAFVEYSNADTDTARDAAAKLHMASIRNHIKGLSDKRYQDIYKLASLDCVVMFIPLEAAFMEAVSLDPGLWQEAWSKNVLMVSPSTLLFVIRSVAQLWRQEQQTRNAQEIASRGGQLYDKFVGFVEDIESIGVKLDQAQKAHSDAMGKLSEGKGNLVRQAQMLRNLGIAPKKALPVAIVEKATEEQG